MSNFQQLAEQWKSGFEIAPAITHGDTAGTLLYQARPSQAKVDIQEMPGPGTVGLSAAERAEFFDIIEPTSHIGDQEGFFHWTQTKLQRIFPHGKLICGYGLLEKDGFHIHTVMGCNFPPEYLQTLQLPGGLTRTPIILKWLSQQQPVLFEPDPNIQAKPEHAEWLQNFHRFFCLTLQHTGCATTSTEPAATSASPQSRGD